MILSQLDAATDPWGIKVERVEVIYHYIYDMIYLYDEFTFYWTEKYICPHSYSRQSFNLLFHTRRFLPVLCFSFKVKDVRLPQNLQRAMAAEAEASREARAKVNFFWFNLEDFFGSSKAKTFLVQLGRHVLVRAKVKTFWFNLKDIFWLAQM